MKKAYAGVLLAAAGLAGGLTAAAGGRKTAVGAPGEIDPQSFVTPSVLRACDVPLKNEYVSPKNLQFPYVSIYYVKPTITTEDSAKVNFFVTDWASSKIRYRDDSQRFTVCLVYHSLPDGAEVKKVQKGVPSGDGSFVLGKLKPGTYRFGIWCVDGKGLESHRVWHEFRVIRPGALDVQPQQVCRVSSDDLKSYGINPNGDLGREVLVDIGDKPDYKKQDELKAKVKASFNAYVAAGKLPQPGATPGYTVLVPAFNGEPIWWPRRYARVIYDAGYDHAAVEADADRTSVGLQKLLDDRKAAGIRKLVLPKGCYRVTSQRALYIPTDFTLDLNGSKLKMNVCEGNSAFIVKINDCVDSHLVNGTLEGDYYEHVYKPSDPDEWVHGFCIAGESRYSSVENVTIRNITGYGGLNGFTRDKKRSRSYFAFLASSKKYVPGGLDPKTGALNEKDALRFSTEYIPLTEEMRDNGWLQVSRYLGYQGLATRSCTMTGCWYDAERRFLTSETLFQYRAVPIPKGAKFLRYSVETATQAEAAGSGLMLTAFRYPWDCAVRNCIFERIRCVGYANQQMKNFLVDGNVFRTCGDDLAQSGIDVEDGGDQMHDATFACNRFEPYIGGKPCSFICHAGHNLIFEGNEGSISLSGGIHSPCVRNNRLVSGSFTCDNRMRSGYGRFEGNSFSKRVGIGHNRMTGVWDHTLALGADDPNRLFDVGFGPHGRVIGETVRGRKFMAGKAIGCRIFDCESLYSTGNWYGCVVSNMTFSHVAGHSFEKCHFINCKFFKVLKDKVSFRDCTLEKCRFNFLYDSTVTFNRCRMDDVRLRGGFLNPGKVKVALRDCKVRLGEELLDIAPFAIGVIGFEHCTFEAGGKKPVSVLALDDYQKVKGDEQPAKISFMDCSFGAGIQYAMFGRLPMTAPCKSTRELTFEGVGNRYAEREGGLFNMKTARAHWTVTERGKKAGDGKVVKK